jgi:hypothetical protein
MKLTHSLVLASLTLTSTLIALKPAQGALVINVVEDGPNLTATAQGTLDLTGLGSPNFTSITNGIFYSDSQIFVVGNGNVDGYGSPFSVVPTNDYVRRGTSFSVSSSTGGGVGIYSRTSLVIPDGYVSNAAINSSSTLNNRSLLTSGLIPGTYNWTLTNNDSITLNIGPQAIPEPSTILATMATVAFGAAFKRRRNNR